MNELRKDSIESMGVSLKEKDRGFRTRLSGVLKGRPAGREAGGAAAGRRRREDRYLLLVTGYWELDFVGVEGGVFDVAGVLDLAHVDDFGATGFCSQIAQLRLSDQGTRDAFADGLQCESEPLGDEALIAAVDEVHRTDFDFPLGQIQFWKRRKKCSPHII